MKIRINLDILIFYLLTFAMFGYIIGVYVGKLVV